MSDENKIYEVQHLPSDGSDSTTTIWIKNHGINKISYANCDTFEGKHNENKVKEGSGVYVWMNRTTNEDGYEVTKEEARYEGDYSNGVRHGYGKIVFPNKDTYEGSFKDGKV